MIESHHFLLLFFNLLLILLHYFVQMFPPFLFIFLKEHKLTLLHRSQRCNNVSSWTSDIFFLNSCGHQATETKEFSHMHTFLGSFKKSGPASQIVCSRVTFPPLAEWKHWARTRLRVYCRKKMGQKYRRTHMNDPFWPTAPKLWVRDANFGLPWKRPKVGAVGVATLWQSDNREMEGISDHLIASMLPLQLVAASC